MALIQKNKKRRHLQLLSLWHMAGRTNEELRASMAQYCQKDGNGAEEHKEKTLMVMVLKNLKRRWQQRQ